MVNVSSSRNVIDIPRDRLDEAADVLALAFADYPLWRYFFLEGGIINRQHIWEAFRLTCEARIAKSDPVKGVIQDGRLFAVACMDSPEPTLLPTSMEQALAEFGSRISKQAAERLGEYGALTAQRRPPEPHFYLIAIGVLPELQGRGYGRLLLNEAHNMSAAHPSSTGVGLDTETDGNVILYEHCGYHVETQTALGSIPVWCMFRPNDAPAAA
jgi:GNAT superfamily N-acetyltransferase